jgi:uncharacterized protein YjdB
LAVGETVQMYAEATFSDGTRSYVTDAVWSSATPDLMTVSPTGSATGIAPGTASIRVQYRSISGETTVSVAAVASVWVDDRDAQPYLPAGTMATLRALYRLTNRQEAEVTNQATWVASDASVATVSGDGKVAGTREGRVTITAIFSGVPGSAEIWVTSPGCSYTVTPTRITPDDGFMVLYDSYEAHVVAPEGCAWRAMTDSPYWEIRSLPRGPITEGGVGSGGVLLVCKGSVADCRTRIASFNVAGTVITKFTI